MIVSGNTGCIYLIYVDPGKEFHRKYAGAVRRRVVRAGQGFILRLNRSPTD
jgi:hypothetical protein